MAKLLTAALLPILAMIAWFVAAGAGAASARPAPHYATLCASTLTPGDTPLFGVVYLPSC